MDDKSVDEIDNNDQISLEDEEDKVEEDCEDDVDSIYDIGDMNKLDDLSDTDNSTMEESTHEDANSYEAKNFRCSKIPPRVDQARRVNIISSIIFGCTVFLVAKAKREMHILHMMHFLYLLVKIC